MMNRNDANKKRMDKMNRALQMILALWLIATLAGNSAAAGEIKPVRGKLDRHAVDLRQSSVSGLSAGGFMASQFFVAYSGIMSGAGVFAGGPYGCARGSLFKAGGACMSRPALLTPEVMAELAENAKTSSGNNRIDGLENLKSKKIFLFVGSADETVRPAVVDRTYDWYLRMGVLPAQIYYKKDLIAGHALPTLAYGNPCQKVSGAPWMGACNYDGAGEALQHIYGKLNPARPVASEDGRLIEFEQKEFVEPEPSGPEELSERTGLNEFGYAFIPQSCRDGKACRIHVVFHGCRQVYNRDPEKTGGDKSGTVFGLQMVLHAGYNEWAHVNRMIILYPQAQKTKVNPYGCFDWWGYLDNTKDTYLTKDAPQMKAVRAMMKALSGR